MAERVLVTKLGLDGHDRGVKIVARILTVNKYGKRFENDAKRIRFWSQIHLKSIKNPSKNHPVYKKKHLKSSENAGKIALCKKVYEESSDHHLKIL